MKLSIGRSNLEPQTWPVNCALRKGRPGQIALPLALVGLDKPEIYFWGTQLVQRRHPTSVYPISPRPTLPVLYPYLNARDPPSLTKTLLVVVRRASHLQTPPCSIQP
jgi:hypothetical protein